MKITSGELSGLSLIRRSIGIGERRDWAECRAALLPFIEKLPRRLVEIDGKFVRLTSDGNAVLDFSSFSTPPPAANDSPAIAKEKK